MVRATRESGKDMVGDTNGTSASALLSGSDYLECRPGPDCAVCPRYAGQREAVPLARSGEGACPLIRVLIADDHVAFRQSLALMLDREPDIAIGAQVETLGAAARTLPGVDVAIVSLTIADADTVELVRALRAVEKDGLALALWAAPADMRILLSAGSAHHLVEHALTSSAVEVLSRSVCLGEIVESVRRLGARRPNRATRRIAALLDVDGERRAQDRVARTMLTRLTPREHEVLQALADGLTDKDIAERLHISNETSRTHMVNILRKLEVDSRVQALVFSIRHGIVRIT